MLKDFIKENEENIISIVATIIIIITIIVIIIMWFFTFSKNDNGQPLNSYEQVNYVEEKTEQYQNIILNLLNTRNVEELYSMMDLEYLNKNNINEENVRNYLLTNNLIGNSIEIVSSTNFSEGEVYIFRFYYKNYNDYKYVNVIEHSPDDYSISFEQEEIDSNTSISYHEAVNQVACDLIALEQTNDYIRYELKITNNNSLDLHVDFNDINTFTLIGDNFSISVAGIVAENITDLTQGSSVTKELYFNISSEQLNNCNYLGIKNLSINNNSFDILIEI